MESTNLQERVDQIQLWQQFAECPFAAQSAAGHGVSSITHNFSPNMECWSDKDNNILPNHPEIIQNLTSRPKDIEAALPVARAAAFNHDLGFGDAILRSFDIDESTSFLQLGKSNLNPFAASINTKHEKREGFSWLNSLSCSGRTGSRLLDISAAAAAAAAGEFHSSSKAASDPGRLDDGEALFSSSNFGQVLPSGNAIQDPSLLVTSSVGMYRQPLDPLIISTRNLGHQAYMQEPSFSPSSSSNNKASSNRNGVPKLKRLMGCSNASILPARKSRTISKTSCAPLKVRKEKLGDRISDLHRLVAPFGKTDTASVLTETIGYIQFLEDQIQTLSAPYMEASLGKPRVIIQKVSKMKGGKQQQDLRSRGLCLVPISFTSCVSFHPR